MALKRTKLQMLRVLWTLTMDARYEHDEVLNFDKTDQIFFHKADTVPSSTNSNIQISSHWPNNPQDGSNPNLYDDMVTRKCEYTWQENMQPISLSFSLCL